MDFSRLISREVNDFESSSVQVVPNLLFNQKDTIEQIYFYYNSKFQTGDIDADGDKKYFFNIVKNPCAVHTKAIDFDTKDIRVLTANGGNPYKTWYFERDLHYWMKDKKFGKVLNRIFKELPIFGSVVLKIVNGNPMFVDLRNFIVSQSADNLDSSSHIIEIHRYTPQQLEKMGKELGWENIDKAIEEFRKMKNAKFIDVYERYGEVVNEDDSISYKRIMWADVGVPEYDYNARITVPSKGVLLDEKEVDEHPYWEFHLDKIPGRWLGIGVVETLFDPQIKQNELANLQSKAGYFRAITIFQTTDTAYNKNLKTDVSDGQVLGVDSQITQVDTSDKNLAYFNEETKKWLANRDELTFSYDVVQGERLPAGTPLGSAQIAATMTMSYFDQIRENVALDIKELIYYLIDKQFKKDVSKEHTLRLVGEDLDTYVQMVKGILVNEEIIKLAIKSMAGMNPFPTEQDKEVVGIAVEQTLKEGKEKLLPIPKNFYDDVKYQIDIEITGENRDSRVYSATLFGGLQAITADPTIIEDPTKRKFFAKYLEAGGVRFEDFLSQAKPQLDQMIEKQGVGGGVSRPMIPQAPMMGQVAEIK